MNFHGESGSIDPGKFLEYIQNQFGTDLANMITARDELAARQGALSAVDDAIKARDAATIALAQANSDAAKIIQDARDKYGVPRGFGSPIPTSVCASRPGPWDPELMGEGGAHRSAIVKRLHDILDHVANGWGAH